MVTHTTEVKVEPGGTVTVTGVPFPPGTEVEVIVLVREEAGPSKYPLRGTGYRFDDPFSPAGVDEWETGR
ncbi:MAG: hypothetical protein HY907_14385 [Deltaproteobacteria bacterium]|nr:hypothetical protein [Deltaproteobacteria bacterium]